MPFDWVANSEFPGCYREEPPGIEQRGAVEQRRQRIKNTHKENQTDSLSVQTDSLSVQAAALSVQLPLAEKTRIFRAITETARAHTDGRQARHRALFELARRLKPIAADRDIDAANLGVFEDVVKVWSAQAGGSAEGDWAAFVTAWLKVRVPAGEGLLDAIQVNVDAGRKLPGMYDDPANDRLLAFAGRLASQSRGGIFWLSVSTAMKIGGWSRGTAHERLRMLVIDGWLKVVESGKPGGRRATRYKFGRRLDLT